MQEKFPITNIFVKYFFSYIFVIVFSIIFTGIFKNIFGFIYPEELGGGWIQLFRPGLLEGFIIAYSFFVPLILTPVFFNNRFWLKILAPYLFFLLIAFWFTYKVAYISILFFLIGTLFGLFAVWLRKKI